MCDELKKKVFCSTSQEWFKIISFPSLQLIPDIQCQEILLTQEQLIKSLLRGLPLKRRWKKGSQVLSTNCDRIQADENECK